MTNQELRIEMAMECAESLFYLRRVAMLAEETPLSKVDAEHIEQALDAVESLSVRLNYV